MNSLLLWAALGILPFVPAVTAGRNAGCPMCECCGCCETGVCGCGTCTCSCCVGGFPTAVEAGRETCCGVACCR